MQKIAQNVSKVIKEGSEKLGEHSTISSESATVLMSLQYPYCAILHLFLQETDMS
jgi:hypothetical protein